MTGLNMSISHNLSEEEAVARIKNLLGEVRKQYADKISDLKEEWNGNTGTFSFSGMGYSVSGTLTVKGDEVKLSGDLPWAAMLFRNKIETIIRERVETLLA